MPQNEIQRMLPRHYQVLELTLAGNGPKEVAQALGMTPQAISLITNSPIFQSEISRRRTDVEKETTTQLALTPTRAKQMMDDLACVAVQVHSDILTTSGGDPRVKQKSADSILDRVFGSGEKTQRQQVVVLEAGAIQLLHVALEETNRSKIVTDVQEIVLTKDPV